MRSTPILEKRQSSEAQLCPMVWDFDKTWRVFDGDWMLVWLGKCYSLEESPGLSIVDFAAQRYILGISKKNVNT